jgi:hypothetical protein
LSTTVDRSLLERARLARPGTDAALVDAALESLLARSRAAEIDACYAAAYEEHPLHEPDAWGDLAAFRAAAGAS